MSREVQVMQAIDELVPGQLVDVLLKGKIDERAAVGNERALLHDPNLLVRHPGAEPGFDFGMLEVKEVTRIVPGKPGALDGLAVPADFRVGLEDQAVVSSQGDRSGEPGDSGSDDEVVNRIH